MALTKAKLIADGVIVAANLHSSHGITSANIGENTNLYFTDARARSAISVSGNALSYNSSTGVITSNFEESPTFTGTVTVSGDLLNISGVTPELKLTDSDDSNYALYSYTDGDLLISTNHGDESGAADTIRFANNGATERMRITSTGAVLIGQTSTVSNHLLTVNGKIGGPTFSDSFLQFTSGNAQLKANDDVIIGYSSSLYVKQSGNVGIGTTSPNAKLDILGASSDQLRLRTAESEEYKIGRNSSTGLLEFYGTQSGYTGYVFGGVNGTRMTIDSSGNTTFTGNVMPAAENAHNIGSASVRWEDLYVDDGYIRNAYIDEYVYHNGDTDTYIRALPNEWVLRTGGSDRLTISDSNTYFTNTSVGIGATSPDRSLDVRGTGMSIYGTGDYTELMLRGQVEGTGTVRNVGSWHWSIRGDIGGDNDDLKLVRFVTGSYVGIAMQVQNSTGDIFFGNTVVNPASGFSNQRGLGYDNSTGNLQAASTSGTAMTIGRNESSDGQILQLRKESNIKHSFGSTTSYLLGSVGIGTTSPVYKLDVDSTAAGDWVTRIKNQSSTGYGLYVQSSNNAAQYLLGLHNGDAYQFIVNGAGQVGIGTTSPESGAKLDVRAGSGGKIVLGSYDANYKVVVEGGDQLNFYNGASGTTAYMNYAGPGNILLSRNLFVEANSSGGTSGTVRIKSDGKVGIGTTSPSANLHIASSGDVVLKLEADTDNVTEGDNPQIHFSQDGGATEAIIGFESTDNQFVINNKTASAPLIFETSDTERMRIDSSGNLSLAAATSLDFNVADFAQIKFKESGAITIDSDNNQSSRNFQFKDGNGSSLMFIGDNGNIGLANTSPNARLDVRGAIATGMATEDEDVTVSLNGGTAVSSGTIEMTQGWTGTMSSGDTVVFRYNAASWKSWALEYMFVSTNGMSDGKIGGYNNNSSGHTSDIVNNSHGMSISYSRDNAGGGTGQTNIITFTFTGLGIHPFCHFKYFQSGGDGRPVASKASITLNS